MIREYAINFIKDLFTLRTVWIDKGRGRWTVKKRFHPLLRSAFWVLAVVLCAGIYSGLNAPKQSEAIPASDVTEGTRTVATLPEPEKLKLDPPVQPAVVPVKESSQEEAARRPKQTQQEPPKQETPKRRTASRRSELTLPSDNNPSAGRIISPSADLRDELVREQQRIRERRERRERGEYDNQRLPPVKASEKSRYSIVITKSDYTLTLCRDGEPVKTYGVAVGRNPGDKQRVGDNRTPVGNFHIVSIENASEWTHDFHDGKGKIKGAYGPWFLRLKAKDWRGIGIHGTHDPNSIGTRATEGCIRLRNRDIAELKRFAYRNMPVTIREY